MSMVSSICYCIFRNMTTASEFLCVIDINAIVLQKCNSSNNISHFHFFQHLSAFT